MSSSSGSNSHHHRRQHQQQPPPPFDYSNNDQQEQAERPSRPLNASLDNILDDNFRPDLMMVAPSVAARSNCYLVELFDDTANRGHKALDSLQGFHKMLAEKGPWQALNNNHSHLVLQGLVELFSDTPSLQLVFLLQLMALVSPIREYYLSKSQCPVPLQRRELTAKAITWCGMAALRNKCEPQELVQQVYNAVMFGLSPSADYSPDI